jgi:3-isopropylmalate/(R)-2-methylmalate dehydratase small subunit
MERFVTLSATACPLGLANVDTDQLIPARFMKRSRAEGYGPVLLHDLRFGADGAALPDFPLNDPRFANARILVARRNFGTGSSREAAVYALWDHGFRCVIAPSFGDIFASNAVKNGLLPATVKEDAAEALLSAISDAPTSFATVDLEARTITCGPLSITFDIDHVRRLQLLNGWDDIDLTERHRKEIDAYRSRRAIEAPWAFRTHWSR